MIQRDLQWRVESGVLSKSVEEKERERKGSGGRGGY